MPPKSKFTKEEIVFAAIAIAERDGVQALTARSLAAELGSSARPVFTVFAGMDEVLAAVTERAKEIYAGYVSAGLEMTPAFKGVGERYIAFAAEHPKLFGLLFMSGQAGMPNVNSVLGLIERDYEAVLGSVMTGFGLDRERAEKLYMHMWTYSHGIATLVATGVCTFTAEQISERLTQVCRGLLKEMFVR